MDRQGPHAAVTTLTSVHQPVMGTVLELSVTAADATSAAEAERSIVEHATALERRLTAFDPASEFCRWRAGEITAPSDELTTLLVLAERGRRASGGAFNPAAGALTRRWLRAATEAAAPSRHEMAELAATIADARYRVVEGGIEPIADLGDLNLNAIAKGFVVDRIAERAMSEFGLVALVVNAGGDLVHRGLGTLTVGIEDPRRPFDNVAPLAQVRFADGAIATSGSARRWFQVGEQRFNQVLDPRTGWPVDQVISASVLAPDAATADVVATVVSVLGTPDGMRFAHDLAERSDRPVDVACMSVRPDGSIERDERWRSLEGPT